MAVTTISGQGAFTADLESNINANFTSLTASVAALSASTAGGTLTSGHILVGNGSNVATDVAMSGDVTLTNAGVAAIKTSVTLTTPVLGVARATSLAIGGATIGSNGLAVTGHLLVEGVTSTGATGTGALVFATTPTLVTPVLGAATGTSVVLSGDCTAATFHAGATAGVTAGPFTNFGSIATIGGLVTTLTGS